MLRVQWILAALSLTLSFAVAPAISLAQPAPGAPDPAQSSATPPGAAAGPATAPLVSAPSQPSPAAEPTAAAPPVVIEPAPALVRFSGYSSLNLGFPTGSVTSSAPLSNMASHAYQIEGGPDLVIARHVIVGVNLGVGRVALGDDVEVTCRRFNVSCTGATFTAGAHVEVLLMPAGSPVVPWIGVEAGYELLALSLANGISNAGLSFTGNQVEIRAGVDFRLREQGGWGPFIAYQSGKYTSLEITDGPNTDQSSMGIPNQSDHGWLLVGLRGRL